MSLYDEFRAAFAEIILPELRAMRADLQDLRDDIWRLRVDLLEREVPRPTPPIHSSRCRARRRRH